MKLETWTCDFEGCDEIAQWYRRSKGQILKLCTKHEALLSRKHWGRSVDYTELTEADMDRLRTKVYWAEYDKEHPFEVLMSKSAEQMKVRVSDLLTGEWRSFTIQTSDLEKLSDNQIKSERKGFVPKPSIDEYIRKLQDGISST